MPPFLARILDRVNRTARKVGAKIQTVVVTVLLFFVYVFGLGMTRLLAIVLFRRYLTLYDRGEPKESYWRDAEGYGPEPERLLKQF